MQEGEEEWQRKKATWFPQTQHQIAVQIGQNAGDADLDYESFELLGHEAEEPGSSEIEEELVEDEDTSEQFDQVMQDAD